MLKHDHDATRDFVSKPIGKSADNMYSYLALVQDDPTVGWLTWRKKPMSNTLFRATRTGKTAGAVGRSTVQSGRA